MRFIIANSDYDYITLIIYVDGVEYNSHLFFTMFEELIEQLKEKNFKLLTGDKYLYGLLYFYRTIVEYMCENKLYLDLSWVKSIYFGAKLGILSTMKDLNLMKNILKYDVFIILAT